MSDDEAAIRDVLERWFAASKRGDTATVLSLMTDDVVFMVPGRKPFGREEFAASAAQMSDVKLDGRSTIEELNVLGDWAYLRSFIELTITSPSGPTVQRSGYTLTIFRKTDDGQWLLARDANLMTAGN
ncbi:SgcJ/EcaC family oxidoreductase [Rhizobium sp. P32RR-XVIII]|nr:SgcJ/EcaC family oxidoreductase [Rhizobium sp. P32RR-XVIII]